jgi:NADH-quinone oxidoreductase subunit B
VFDLGLACCAVEFIAATMRAAGLAAAGPPAAAASPPIEVLVVSGTVTDVMAPAVKRRYDALPEPKRVMSFGSCANSGGPYWDSYCVTKGVDQLIPVDVRDARRGRRHCSTACGCCMRGRADDGHRHRRFRRDRR